MDSHRVYKNFDPRSKLIRAMCHRYSTSWVLGNDPFFIELP